MAMSSPPVPPAPPAPQAPRPGQAPAAASPPPQPAAAGQAGPGAPQPGVDLPEHYEQPISFWQHPFVLNVLPFLTSLALHLGLIIIGLLTIKVFQAVVMPIVREQVVVAESGLEEQNVDGVLNAGFGGDPTRAAAQDKFPDVPPDSKGLAEKKGPDLNPRDLGGGSGESESALIARGPNTMLGAGGGLGAGKGDGIGGGDGDGSGVLAPFGIPGGGVGPRVGFIGRKDSAKKVAYVCDASGSMLDMFDSLRVEIRKSVDGLRPTQSFNVVFFQENQYLSVDKASLLMGNPENKRKTLDFLGNVVPRGTTDPIPALDAVSKMEPELIWLLTDGDFSGPGNEKVIEFCKAKFGTKTKVNTIAFISKDSKDNPQDLGFVKALKEIASNSGGKFSHVSEDDMGH